MVDGDHRHRRVEAVVVEGQVLGARLDDRRRAGAALGDHPREGSTAVTSRLGRLVGAGPGADVEHGARVAERRLDAGRDPRVGAAHLRRSRCPVRS